MQLTAPTVSSRYFLRTSGDEAVQAAGQGAGIVLSFKTDAAFLDWISGNSPFCAVILHELVGVRKDSFVKRSLFATPAYASTDCRADTQKHECYEELTAPVHKS